MNKTTANVLEAMTCVGLITGTAYLIKVDEVEASAVCSTNEFARTTQCNKTSINMKKTNFNQDNFGVVFKLSILFGKFHFIFLIFLVARMNSDYRQGLHMVH